ncbi:MAG: ABC transporter ATP-binding protein [Spirochaetales bacterium]|nr:ABC transporter ATP-binding protein [Spirochaetales bacterium]MBP7262902.1 ABC transporter ATP-binding protein [Spirochaetia bacterium]
MSLVIDTLRKAYDRRSPVLKGLSLEIGPAKAYALIGPNGAGKSTTIKAIIGSITVDSGSVRFAGMHLGQLKKRRGLSYLPEVLAPPRNLALSEYLDAMAELKGLAAGAAKTEYTRMAGELGIEGALKARISTFSKGMRKKAGLIQAFLGSPELIILDEPTSDLDPVARRVALDMVKAKLEAGSAVLMTSHILTDLERVCHKAGLLKDGVVSNEIVVGDYKRASRNATVTLERRGGSETEKLECLKLGGPEVRLDGAYRLADVDYATADLEDWYHAGLGERGVRP